MCEPEEPLPGDLGPCHEFIRQQAETIRGAQRRIGQREHQVEQLLHGQHGARRERFDPDQLRLFADEAPEGAVAAPAAEPPESEAAKSKRHWLRTGRHRLPEGLPREWDEYELPPEELPCPDCGHPRVQIGEETSEQLYAIETAGATLSAAVRHTPRQQESVPLPTAFGEWLNEQERHVLPRRPIGQAIAYARSNRASPCRYPEHADLRIGTTSPSGCSVPGQSGGATGRFWGAAAAAGRRSSCTPWPVRVSTATSIPWPTSGTSSAACRPTTQASSTGCCRTSGLLLALGAAQGRVVMDRPRRGLLEAP